LIRSAELQENPEGSDQVEMVLKVQGVGPGQPRQFVIPFALLVQDESLDPDNVVGRGFEAEIGQDDRQRWVADRIAFASKVLRSDD